MKIFISWSGVTSQQIAQELRDFMPLVLQGVEPFITSVDIEKGARWQGEIAKQLDSSNYGLVCLTRQNLTSQWLAFEAGALSKHLEGRVSTVLFNINHNDVEMPLGMFQGTLFRRDEFRQLVGNINNALPPELTRPEAQLSKLFDKFWPELEQAVTLILEEGGAAAHAPPPTPFEVLSQEVLALLREQNRYSSDFMRIQNDMIGRMQMMSEIFGSRTSDLARLFNDRFEELARRTNPPRRRSDPNGNDEPLPPVRD